jgi:UPF0176 protein
VTATTPARPTQRLRHRQPQSVEPAVNPAVEFLYEDEAIIVLHKPAPLPMHAGGRFARNTLDHFLRDVFAPLKPRAAHRLDANTSGVVVVSKTQHVARQLQPQFERSEVEKLYLLRVTGTPTWTEQTCAASISTEPGPAGVREISADGAAAQTDFVFRRAFADGTSLLTAAPQTGRTNQIRLHAAHLGHPIVGDPTYGGRAFTTQTLAVTDPPLCLHAWQVSFRHPLRDEWMNFTAPLPAWASD